MKEVSVPNVGYELKADLYETEHDQVLLVLPGYTSTKKKYNHMVQYIVDKTGFSALVLDYGGHGESPFELDELSRADNFSDVIVAFDWLNERYPGKKITVVGTSYGGFHAAYLTKFRKFENILFRVPASYPEEELYHVFKTMDDRHGGDYRFKEENYDNHWLFSHTDSVNGKAMLITHQLDIVCPPVSTMPFGQAYDAEHWEAPGFKHGFGESDVTNQQITEYYDKIVEWLKK